MNIKEYISSGILEAYVLGDVSDQERAEIEANLQRYPELKEELQKVEEAQEAFLLKTAITPRKQVKERLMAQIDIQINSASPSMKAEAKVIPLVDPNTKWWKMATAASVSIAVVASYLALDYKGQLNTTRESLDNLTAQNQRMAQDYNVVNQRLDNIENTIKVIDNPSYRRVVMKGTDASKNSLASIYWNESTSEVYMTIQNLRELSKDQQFQLWAIVDGKPVDAGVFNLTAGLQKMKNIANASAFAVTIEPTGGSTAPTLESMQVIGTI